MYTHIPDMPFYDSLVKEHGMQYVVNHYFDEDDNVRDDAPQQLKREIELLRRECLSTPYGIKA